MNDEAPTVSVSVVIPTRNGGSRLAHTLEPLLNDPLPIELVVVVDGPDPETELALERLCAADPRVDAVITPNRGPAAARHEGVRQARGDVILFLDDDVVARPGLVEGHARHHAKERSVVVVGYMPVSGGPVSESGTFTSRLYASDYERACEKYERDQDRILLDLWGGNVSIRRSDCRRVGIASSAFPLRYHEDRDFGVRCYKAGLTGVFDRALRADHRHVTGIDSFFTDAREQGAARLLVHRIHEDVLGPLDDGVFAAELPALARYIVRITRWRSAYATARPVLRLALRACERLRLAALELMLARLVRRIEQQQGALELGRSA